MITTKERNLARNEMRSFYRHMYVVQNVVPKKVKNIPIVGTEFNSGFTESQTFYTVTIMQKEPIQDKLI